jgi:hypothetical protein
MSAFVTGRHDNTADVRSHMGLCRSMEDQFSWIAPHTSNARGTLRISLCAAPWTWDRAQWSQKLGSFTLKQFTLQAGIARHGTARQTLTHPGSTQQTMIAQEVRSEPSFSIPWRGSVLQSPARLPMPPSVIPSPGWRLPLKYVPPDVRGR